MSPNYGWLAFGYTVAWVCELFGVLLGANLVRVYRGKIGPIRLRTDNINIVGDSDEERLAGRISLLELRVRQIEDQRRWDESGVFNERRQARATVFFLVLGGVVGLITTLFWIY